MNTQIGSIPLHKYIFVDSRYTHEEPCGFVPAVWFGLVSIPGRAWGCNVMLECGAVYRSIPPHAIAFTQHPEVDWKVDDAQMWDCYGYSWSAHQYTFLTELRCKAYIKGKPYSGTYLFTVAPVGDGFSQEPSQSKEFKFIELDNGRLTIQPTNRVTFIDKSFTEGEVPKLRLQEDTYSCE